jgi:hypothetical protein
VQRLRSGEEVGLVTRSLEVSRQELYRWPPRCGQAWGTGVLLRREWRRSRPAIGERDSDSVSPNTSSRPILFAGSRPT